MKKPLSLILAVGLFLAACTSPAPLAPTEVPTPQANEVVSLCDNYEYFLAGDEVVLGSPEGGEYLAVLRTYTGLFSSYNLALLLEDGTEFIPSGGELPKEAGKEVSIKWGQYVQVRVANCGIFYHYEVELAGAESKPVLDVSCPVGYRPKNLKPWPFLSVETVWTKGEEAVKIGSASDAPLYLIRVLGEEYKGQVKIERPNKTGQTTTGRIAVTLGELVVTVKNCDGNYFFKAELQPAAVRPVKYKPVMME